MSSHLSDRVKTIRIENNAASAQTAVISDSRIDMSGYTGVRFICLMGTIDATGTVSMAVHESATDAHGSAITGATAAAVAADDDKMLIVDVQRPTLRYLSVEVTRGTADSEVDGIIAELYGPRDEAVTQDSSVKTLTKIVDS